MTASRSADGFSVLELLVVVTILSALTVLAALSLRPPTPPTPAGADALFRLLLDARATAVLSGTTGTVAFEAGRASFGDKMAEWTGVLQIGAAAAPSSYSLVVNSDGTFSGERLAVLVGGERRLAPGIYRSEQGP